MPTNKSLLKLITAENDAKANGSVSDDDYNLWKENILKKMDVFLLCDRITEDQYKTLEGMFL